MTMNVLNGRNRNARNRLLGSTVALAVLGSVAVALAHGRREDPHAHCHVQGALPPPREEAPKKTAAQVELPDVTLVRADGKKVELRQEIDDGRPVMLNFIFTTCTAICPVMSQTLARVQGQLVHGVHMISVSIDPEQDTPSRLAEYARRFGAGPAWTFYTGTPEAIVAMQRAFDVYRGNKMNHVPVTFLRAAPGKSWVRVDGFAGADELVKEYRQLVAAR
jgi:protein SCO1/2